MAVTTTALDLNAIKARTEAATPGPWGAGNDTFIGIGIENDGAGGFAYDVILAEITPDRERQDDPNTGRVKLGTVEADGEFIAHAREDVPALIAEVERLREENDRVRELHSPFKIYDECGHRHEATDEGVQDITHVGLVCEDGYMYTACRWCCTDAMGDQTEECVTMHDHSASGIGICETRRALGGAETAV